MPDPAPAGQGPRNNRFLIRFVIEIGPDPALADQGLRILQFLIEIVIETGPIRFPPGGGSASVDFYFEL